MSKYYKSQISQLKDIFTDDAWDQFSNYTQVMIDKLAEYNVSDHDQAEVLETIFQFIRDYRLEEKPSGKINFTETLSLLNEIGSPSEIINDMIIANRHEKNRKHPNSENLMSPDQNQSINSRSKDTADTSSSNKCPECNWNNPPFNVHCQNCGLNLRVEYKKFSPLKQYIIDHPYISTLISILLVYFLIVIGFILAGGFFSINFNFAGFVLFTILFIGVPTWVIGSIIASMYQSHISFQVRYEREISYFEYNFLMYNVLFFICIFVYVVVGAINAGGNPVGGIIVTFSGPLFILLGLIFEDSNKPQEIEYMTLVKLKNKVGKITSNQLLKRQPSILLINGSISVITHFTLFEKYGTSNPWVAVPGYITFILLWMVSLSIIGMYYYSWPYLKKLVNSNL